jgi:hypothetical protein
MFFLKNRNITIFLTIAALTLWANVGFSQTEWKKYPGNPVLDLGPSGTWDDYDVSGPTVLFDGKKYQMWYYGSDGSNYEIGYATSADGIVWVKIPPILCSIRGQMGRGMMPMLPVLPSFLTVRSIKCGILAMMVQT